MGRNIESDRAFEFMRRFISDEHHKGYNITIIGTAVSNDRISRRIGDIEKCGIPSHCIELTLTKSDKERILKNLGVDSLTIDSRTYERLIAIDKFYSFLLQAYFLSQNQSVINNGIPSETVEEWRLKELKENQPRLYGAYKYICLAHQYNLSFPLSLIQKVEQSKYFDILYLSGREDWIFDSVAQYENISLESAHWFLAKIYWDVYVQSESPQYLLNEMLNSASPANYTDSLFVAHIFRVLQEQENKSKFDLKRILKEESTKISGLQTNLSVDTMCMWGQIYRRFEMEEEEWECLTRAKKYQPINVADLRVLVPLIEDETPVKALELFHKWLTKEPNNGTLKVAYLEFLSRKSKLFPEEIQKVLNEYQKWIKDIGEQWDAVQNFIKFNIKHSPEPNKPSKLQEITFAFSKWLSENPDDSNASAIWNVYIKLMKYYESKEVMSHILEECWNWLSKHNETRGFLSLIPLFISEFKRYATPIQKEEVLEFLLNWIALHPKVDVIKSACLSLIDGEWLTQDRKKEIIKRIANNIMGIDDTITVSAILSIYEKLNDKSELSRLIDDMKNWFKIESHSQDDNLKAHYLRLVSDYGTSIQVDATIAETQPWLNLNTNQTVLPAYIALVERRGTRNLRIDLINNLDERLGKIEFSNEATVRTKYLILVKDFGSIEQVERAISQTNEWWESNFDETVISAFLKLIETRKKGDFDLAKDKAKIFLSEYPNKYLTLQAKIKSIESVKDKERN